MTKSQNRKIIRSQDADSCIFTRDYGVPLRIPRKYAVVVGRRESADADLAPVDVPRCPELEPQQLF